jgi:hypothetical protein
MQPLCCSHAVPLPCLAAPSFFDSSMSFVKVRVEARNIQTELRMVARRSQRQAGRPHAVWMTNANSHMPCPSCAHAMLCRGLEKSLSERHCHGMAWVWQGPGMACVNQTWPHRINQMGKTQSKPLVAWHGRGMAWA